MEFEVDFKRIDAALKEFAQAICDEEDEQLKDAGFRAMDFARDLRILSHSLRSER